MKIDTSKLKNAKTVQKDGKPAIVARCPACSEQGLDHTGDHLIIYEDGRFGCVVHGGAEAACQDHRKRVFQLVGTPTVIHQMKIPSPRRSPLTMTPIVKKTRVILISRTPPPGPAGVSRPKAPALKTNTPGRSAVGEASVREGGSINAQAAPGVPHQQVVRSRTQLAHIAEMVHLAESPVALSIKTTGSSAHDPSHGQLRLLCQAVPGREPWLIDLKTVGRDLGVLSEVLQQKEVIGHDIKRQALWLRAHYGLRLPRLFCTMTASQLLTNGSDLSDDLAVCLQRHLAVTTAADKAGGDWSEPILAPELLARATDDVRHLSPLQTTLAAALTSAGLDRVAALEMALLPGVVEMELHGVPFDHHPAEALLKEYQETAAAIERLLKAAHGADFNPNSPEQIKKVLEGAGIHVLNTSEPTLLGCPHPVAKQILDYRQAMAPARQVDTLLKAVAADGRIHAVFNPFGAVTGRFTSESPSLQNIKRGALRRCFAAPDGQVLVVADYSQIELRIAAECAGESRMIEAFQRNQDLHVATASSVLEKPAEDVTPEDRQLAKAVNFGLIYGQSPEGLIAYARSAYGVTLSLDKAKRIHRKFFDAYPGLKAWHEDAWRKARAGVCAVRTVSGRRRQIPATSSAWDRFTALVNTPVQGGAADGLKAAMVALAQRIPAGAHTVLTVHDELVVMCPEASGQQVSKIVQQIMKESMAQMFPSTRIEVEASVCRNWGEK